MPTYISKLQPSPARLDDDVMYSKHINLTQGASTSPDPFLLTNEFEKFLRENVNMRLNLNQNSITIQPYYFSKLFEFKKSMKPSIILLLRSSMSFSVKSLKSADIFLIS